MVDWSAGSQATYPVARWRVEDVGVVIGRYVDWLYQHGFTQFSRVNLVGHSLGSHVAGHAGKTVTLGRINAIFGTDPAGDSLFDYNDPSTRLAADDAFYTEAIVTNTGIVFEAAIAHANFYPVSPSNKLKLNLMLKFLELRCFATGLFNLDLPSSSRH